LYFPQEPLIDSDIDRDSEVKPGVPVKPVVIHSPKTTEKAQQDIIIPPSSTEATPGLQSPNVVTVNTPPPITVLENSPTQAPEGGLEREKVVMATLSPRLEPPIVTLTTADGGSAVDVDMEDASISQSNGGTKASSS
jgi:hypothetical protein